MLLEKFGTKSRRFIMSSLFVLSIFSSGAESFWLYFTDAFGALKMPGITVRYTIPFFNIAPLFLFGFLTHRYKHAVFSVMLCISVSVAYIYWIFLCPICYLGYETMICFTVTGIPSVIIIWLFAEYAVIIKRQAEQEKSRL